MDLKKNMVFFEISKRAGTSVELRAQNSELHATQRNENFDGTGIGYPMRSAKKGGFFPTRKGIRPTTDHF